MNLENPQFLESIFIFVVLNNVIKIKKHKTKIVTVFD